MPGLLTRPSAVDAPKVELDEDKVPRDRYKRPLIIPRDGGKPKPYTRMTTFIDCIEDKSSIATWKQRTTLVGAARDPSRLADVVPLDPEDSADKRKLNKIAEELFVLGGGEYKSIYGSHLHSLTEYADDGEELPSATRYRQTVEEDRLDIEEYSRATSFLRIRDTERLVVLDDWKVAGTPDRISYYEGDGPDGEPLACHLITDLKTGTTEYGMLKMASQLAGYSRGEHYDIETGERTPIGDVSQDWGIIINLRPGSRHAELYWADLNLGWEAFTLAWTIRDMRRRGNKALIPFVR